MKTLVSWGWLLAVLFGLPAFVQAQVWVVLGSFQSQANAAAEVAKVQAAASAPVRVASFDTPKGRLHRVLAGEFGGQEEAMPVLDAFRRHGYPDAWLLMDGVAQSSPDAAPPASTEDEAHLDTSAGPDAWDGADEWRPSQEIADLQGLEGLEGWESFVDLSDLPSLDGSYDFTDLPQTAPAELLLPEHPPLVSEPPPGYQLHKLRRSR